jgi:DNA-binding beta-propeller fold protein YncE
MNLRLALAASALTFWGLGGNAAAQLVGSKGGVVVANRGSGSISVVDVLTSAVNHVPLPMAAGDNPPEPMYVTYSAINDLVFVGDRANDRVVAFNAFDFSVNTTIPAGDGVFHMWSDDARNQLWVNNDVDKTVSVINLTTLVVDHTFSTPADLNALGGTPHDVILDPNAPVGYLTMVGVVDPANPSTDAVVAFSASTFTETDRSIVGDDPHVSLSAANNLLFVTTQGADRVSVLDRSTLDHVPGSPIAIPNAHGAGMSSSGDIFYTTNITGGGVDALFAIDTTTLTLAGPSTPDNTSFPTPHNIALSPDNQRLYVTHSGATATKVSVFDVTNLVDPVLLGTVDAQLNPFGIATVPAIPEPSAWLLAVGGAGPLLRIRRGGRLSAFALIERLAPAFRLVPSGTCFVVPSPGTKKERRSICNRVAHVANKLLNSHSMGSASSMSPAPSSSQLLSRRC